MTMSTVSHNVPVITPIDYIINSQRINLCINKISHPSLRDDFRQHFYQQILEMNPIKLTNAYTNGYLDYLCIRIINNQYNSKSSSFFKHYKSNFNRPHDDIDSINDLPYLEDNHSTIDVMEEIMELLKGRHYYHSHLWKMYYLKEMTYKQIEKETQINFQSVRKSVIKTNKWLHKKLNDSNE